MILGYMCYALVGVCVLYGVLVLYGDLCVIRGMCIVQRKVLDNMPFNTFFHKLSDIDFVPSQSE